jgi:hypothetical protein
MPMTNTASRGQISEKEATVFWINMAGDLMMAPDTRVAPFPGWTRIVCRTAGETEFYSRKLAAQEFANFRSLKVEDHLRYKSKRDEIKSNCRLRLAKGCISAADEFATRTTLRNLELKDELLYKLLATEPDLSRASLEIEKYDASSLRQRQSSKRRGLADDEVDSVATLIEGVR